MSMNLISVEITGLRGFAQTATLSLAQPDGKSGSGITVLVGPNNGGKSTIIEDVLGEKWRTSEVRILPHKD